MTRNVALFATCLGDQLWPEVVEATVAVLERAGCRVTFDPAQTCCAQPAFNSGYHDEAKAVARRFVEIFERADAIVAPSGSCTAMVHRYPELFRDEPEWRARAEAVAHKAHELSAFLVRELGVHDEPRRLLRAVAGLELVELRTGESCCGFGGTFAVKFPELSTAMLDHKLSGLDDRVDVLSAVDSSCLMQMRGRLQRQGSRVRAMHLAEILASR